MLDKLMDSIGGDVISSITEKAGITNDQAKQVLPIAQDSLQSGLMEQISSGGIGNILGMFQSKGDGLLNNPLFAGIKNNIMKGVMTKMGLPESVAGMVAGSGLSSIVGSIAGKASAAGDTDDIDESSLMNVLGGGGSGGGLGDMLGNMAKDKLGDIAKDKLGGIGKLFG
ncbi:MAG: DUF937 domain-containing protein [Bacteroidota bacterium]